MQLYLLNDISILADVFETVRANLLKEYKLDFAYYMSAPHLAWIALLKFINRPIHLITYLEMYRIIQPNIIGGICHASVRNARANNKLLAYLCNFNKPTLYILYVHANNLHCWAMSQQKPDDKIEWLSNQACR